MNVVITQSVFLYGALAVEYEVYVHITWGKNLSNNLIDFVRIYGYENETVFNLPELYTCIFFFM